MISTPEDVARVRAALHRLGIDVDEPTAAALAEDDRDRMEQTRGLFDYDLDTVDSALELTRRGRR